MEEEKLNTRSELAEIAAKSRAMKAAEAYKASKTFVEKKVMPKLKRRAEHGHNYRAFAKIFFKRTRDTYQILKEDYGYQVKVHPLTIEIFW